MKTGLALCLAVAVFGFCLPFPNAAEKYQSDGLTAHNQFRSKHQSQPLKLSTTLNTVALRCAQYYIDGGEFHSCPNAKNLGENIRQDNDRDFATVFSDAITTWYKESKFYNYTSPENSTGKIGHFTQLVWRSSTELGLGCAASIANKKVICVAVYEPAGNLKGAYKQNVLKPIGN